jgi:polyisoprenoid-binding protein YceI
MPRVAMIGLSAVLAVALVGAGGWYFFIRGDEPPPVSLADAISGSAAATATSTATSAAPADGAAAATGATSSGTGSDDGDLAGAWVVDGSASFVGYRIDEELASIGATTAVGRTAAVEGSLEFDGSSITAVEVVADLTQLESDDSRRDGQLRRQSLETNTYPTATFVLAEPIAIEGDPALGEAIAATAVGDLTLHGVTNRVTLALEGQYVDGVVVVVGSTVIALADYEIDPPSAMMVVSVADEATMEMQLVFRRA